MPIVFAFVMGHDIMPINKPPPFEGIRPKIILGLQISETN